VALEVADVEVELRVVGRVGSASNRPICSPRLCPLSKAKATTVPAAFFITWRRADAAFDRRRAAG